MTLATLTAFALLELTLCLIPGPAVLLTISTALRRGPRAGFAAAGGILAGNTLYFVLSGAGVIALLLASYRVFTIVKWGGAAYLAYLGVRALLARPHHAFAGANASGERSRSFGTGFVTQVANPKAVVFFVAIVPQFIDPRGQVAFQIGVLTLVSATIEFGVLSSYIVAAAWLRRSAVADRAVPWVERAGGVILLGIAARIVREPLIVAP